MQTSRLPRNRSPVRQRGGAMLEFAITVPLFMALLLALVDFGTYFIDRAVLTSAAYNGARAGAGMCDAPNDAQVRDRVIRAAGRMLADGNADDRLVFTEQSVEEEGPKHLHYYLLELAYTRPTGLQNFFTESLNLDTVEVTGLAICRYAD